MEDNGVRIETVEAELRSEIDRSLAKIMKVTYLPISKKNPDADTGLFAPHPDPGVQDQKAAGPDAVISVTKISARTPRDVIKNLLKEDPDREKLLRNSDFYTMVFSSGIQREDPSTTRFINATITFLFPPDVKILDYSPKERGTVSALIKSRGTGISLSPALDLSAGSAQSTELPPGTTKKPFEFSIGPDTKITGTYHDKYGYSLDIPCDRLLEYRVMLKNEHEVYGEVYPPMPTPDLESNGKENLAVFSFIVQTPRDLLPEITVPVESKVKGSIWGVISLKGRVVF